MIEHFPEVIMDIHLFFPSRIKETQIQIHHSETEGQQGQKDSKSSQKKKNRSFIKTQPAMMKARMNAVFSKCWSCIINSIYLFKSESNTKTFLNKQIYTIYQENFIKRTSKDLLQEEGRRITIWDIRRNGKYQMYMHTVALEQHRGQGHIALMQQKIHVCGTCWPTWLRRNTLLAIKRATT